MEEPNHVPLLSSSSKEMIFTNQPNIITNNGVKYFFPMKLPQPENIWKMLV